MPSPVQARSAARPSSADASNRFAPRAHLAHRSPHAACGSVVAYDRQTRKAIADLGDAIDTDAATAVWDAALGTPYAKEPVWVHGDVAQNNLLVRDGCLRAVIDFGTSAVGDPACDTVLAWTFLDGESREAFRERLPVVDEELTSAVQRRPAGVWCYPRWPASPLVRGHRSPPADSGLKAELLASRRRAEPAFGPSPWRRVVPRALLSASPAAAGARRDPSCNSSGTRRTELAIASVEDKSGLPRGVRDLTRPEEGTMPEIETNGVRLHYDIAGDGPPLVFVHGMCGRGAVWTGQVERLADQFTCVTYDRRGHGSSNDGEVSHSVPLHGDDFAALVKALGLSAVVLVGSSGGARVGVDVVLRYSELLAGAVLSEPPVFSLGPDEATQFMGKVVPVVQPHLDAGDLSGAVDAFFGVVCPGLWRLLDETDKEPYRQSGLMLVADLGQPPFVVTPEDLAAVRLPVLAIAGLDSDPFLRGTPRVIASSVPSAELVEFADCGHVTYAEQPDAFAEAVRSFAERALRTA